MGGSTTTTCEEDFFARLHGVRHWRAVPVVMFTDPGADLDDEMALIMARYLIEFGFIELKCVIATLAPSFQRALLARGTLDLLGLHSVPVGYGSDGGAKSKQPTAEMTSYVPRANSERASSIQTSRTVLRRVLLDAVDPIVVCLVASCKDFALFLRDNENLSVEKIRQVVVMGGVQDGTLQPDSAHNNAFDQAASRYVYERCQVLGIELVVVGRKCAYAVPLDRGVYEDLAVTGSPIGWRLRNAQRKSIETLWRRAASSDPEVRAGLPARCDRDWFSTTFCGGENNSIKNRGPNDRVWDLVQAFNMYDTLALVAAVPLLRQQFFDPVSVPVQVRSLNPNQGDRVNHLLIGACEGLDKPDGFASQRARDECRALFTIAYKTGLALDHHQKTQVVLTMQARDGFADETCGMALLRSLVEFEALDLLGVVVGPARRFDPPRRVRAAADKVKSTLAALGLDSTPVVVQHAATDGCQLEELYKTAPDAGVRLVVAHSQALVAQFVGRCPNLFRDKTVCVICLGGAKLRQDSLKSPRQTSDVRNGSTFTSPVLEAQQRAGSPSGRADVLSASTANERRPSLNRSSSMDMVQEPSASVGCYLEADRTATNVLSDAEAADFFTKECQDLGVPMVVISRHLAQACRVPRTFFDTLSEFGGTVGADLVRDERTNLNRLFRKCALPAGHPDRDGLADRCDSTWFSDSFESDRPSFEGARPPSSRNETPPFLSSSSGKREENGESSCSRPNDDDVWPRVAWINTYLPLVLLASVPRIAHHFFADCKHYVINTTDHVVLGRDAALDPGLRDELRLLVCRLILKGLRMNSTTELDPEAPALAEVHLPRVGTIDLSDAIPPYIDLHHERCLRKAESLELTVLKRVIDREKKPPSSPAAAPRPTPTPVSAAGPTRPLFSADTKYQPTLAPSSAVDRVCPSGPDTTRHAPRDAAQTQ